VSSPLDPIQSDEQLLANILRTYPGLTREEVLEMAAAFGFDLQVEPTAPARKSPARF